MGLTNASAIVTGGAGGFGSAEPFPAGGGEHHDAGCQHTRERSAAALLARGTNPGDGRRHALDAW
jgi:hypothetical protein